MAYKALASTGGGSGGAVSSVFGRTGAVTAQSGDYTVSQITGAAPSASPTFTGTTTAPEYSASGLSGATSASRYVGGTTGGAKPSSGTWSAGDYVIDEFGIMWIYNGSAWSYVGDPPVQALGSISGTNAVDWTKSSRYSLTMTGNTTLTFTNPITPKALRLYVTNTGSFTLTLPTYLRSGGINIVVTTGNATDVLAGDWDGTHYYWADALPNVS